MDDVRPADTSPEAHRVQIELLRRASTAQRFQLARALSDTTLRLSWRAIRQENPCASEEELALAFARLLYGRDLADRLRGRLLARTG